MEEAIKNGAAIAILLIIVFLFGCKAVTGA